MPTTTTTTTETDASGAVTTVTTTVSVESPSPVTAAGDDGAGDDGASASESFEFDPQNCPYEHPDTLPFGMPAGLDDVDDTWMTALLRHRGMIPAGGTVTSIEKTGVGLTAGYFSAIAKVNLTYSSDVPAGTQTKFVVKAWPPLELLPKEAIGNMFLNDIKGYCDFAQDEWFPRPGCYLASYDAEANLYALVLDDADEYAVHRIHDDGFNLHMPDTLRMIPEMAKFAARFENCHDESTPMGSRCSFANLMSSKAMLDLYLNPAAGGKPFADGQDCFDEWVLTEFGGDWKENGMENYSALFAKKYDAFWARADPANGASVTLAHGDLRGDNLFFSDRAACGWMAIDFQLMLKGPIPTDLAYLMSSATVLPEVYQNEEMVLKYFYEEFQKHTKAYKSDVYSFEQFKQEYEMMQHLVYVYFVGMGAVIWQSSKVDGKLDPSQPDVIVGPVGASPEIGTGALKVEDMTPEDTRKRMWWAKATRNLKFSFKAHGGKEFLATLPDNTW